MPELGASGNRCHVSASNLLGRIAVDRDLQAVRAIAALQRRSSDSIPSFGPWGRLCLRIKGLWKYYSQHTFTVANWGHIMLVRCATFAAGAMLVLASNAIAQEVRVEKDISLVLASDAAAAAMQFCTEKGWNVSVTVVDRAGNVKALLRSDNAGPHTVDSSRRKAYTAATLQQSTTVMMGIIEKNPGLANLKMIDGFLLLGGGQPIRVGNEVIGAIAVAGAPGGDLDEQCADAGISKIRERLK